MSDIRVVGASTPTRLTSDGNFISPRGLRDGTVVVTPLEMALSVEGRMFTAQNGDETTPLTFLALAANRPDAWLRAQGSAAIVLPTITVTLEAAAGTVTEIDVRIADNDIGNGTSTAATVGPYPTNTGGALSANTICRHLATGDTTAGTNERTVWRLTIPFANATTEGNQLPTFDITPAMMGYPILKGGAGSIMVYISATTTQATGFVTWKWGEVPNNSIY